MTECPTCGAGKVHRDHQPWCHHAPENADAARAAELAALIAEQARDDASHNVSAWHPGASLRTPGGTVCLNVSAGELDLDYHAIDRDDFADPTADAALDAL